jgi:hypothetical protein
MKRFLVLLGVPFLCVTLSGCTSDPQGDAVRDVVNKMQTAAADIEGIDKAVNTALKKHEDEKAPLDFTEAFKMAKNLEKTGKDLQDLKVRSFLSLPPLNDEQKATLESQVKVQIEAAFKGLVDAKTALTATLKKAEAVDREKTEELRTKIQEAEGPFANVARQG